MAIAFIDGFDKYGKGFASFQTSGPQIPYNSLVNTIFANEWTVSTGSPNPIYIAPPLGPNGQSIGICGVAAGGATLTHTFTSAFPKAIGGVRFQPTTAGGNINSAIVLFKDSGSVQAQIQYNSTTNSLVLANNSTVIATFTGVISLGTTHFIEWNITMSATGAWQLWLDGVSLGSGTASFHTTANNSYNQIALQTNGNGVNVNGPNVAFDDLYVDDGIGAPLLTNPIVDTEFATSDSSVAFTNGAFAVGFENMNMQAATGPAANSLFLRKITPPVNCTLNSVVVVPAGTVPAANFKAVLYADSAGAPGALTATGTQVTGTVVAVPLALPFAAGQALTGGTSYWIGYITDTSVGMAVEATNTTVGWQKNNTYASGAPNPAGTATTTTFASLTIWGAMSGIAVNWRDVSNNPSFGYAGDYSYVTGNVVGNEDLYGVAALGSTPSTIYAVKVSAYLKDSAAGARTVTINTKSSTTDSAGTNAGFTPGTTYGWFSSYWLTDPNGSIAWTQANLNAALMGFKITA